MSTILLVEDELSLRSVLSEYLTFSGYQVVAAAGGAEAMERARSSAIDVVVSDVLMPGIDGLELCKRFRADPALAPIPFLFVTARNVDERLSATLAEIGDGIILKPFEPARLLALIAAALAEGGSASGRRSERARPAP